MSLILQNSFQFPMVILYLHCSKSLIIFYHKYVDSTECTGAL